MDGENKATLSPFALVSNWFHDGSLTTEVPKELMDSKAISPMFILYYFQSSPQYFVFINKLFNNFNITTMKTVDILKMMKEIIVSTGFKQPWNRKAEKSNNNNKLCGILKKKYPYYRNEEISMCVDYIDSHDEIKEFIYEMVGLRNISKKKMTKKEFKEKMSNIISKESLLNSI